MKKPNHWHGLLAKLCGQARPRRSITGLPEVGKEAAMAFRELVFLFQRLRWSGRDHTVLVERTPP
jgi:hypothetical protein